MCNFGSALISTGIEYETASQELLCVPPIFMTAVICFIFLSLSLINLFRILFLAFYYFFVFCLFLRILHVIF